MNSDGQGSDEDSRLEEPNNHTNGDAKAETSSNIKISLDDGDESSVASTSKDAKSQARDRENNISPVKSKTKNGIQLVIKSCKFDLCYRNLEEILISSIKV